MSIKLCFSFLSTGFVELYSINYHPCSVRSTARHASHLQFNIGANDLEIRTIQNPVFHIQYFDLGRLLDKNFHQHQPINAPTVRAQVFLMDYT
jgi:hypothetical protein